MTGIKVVQDATMGLNEVAIEFHPGDAAPPPDVLRVSGMNNSMKIRTMNDVPPPPSSHVVVRVGAKVQVDPVGP